jgi:small subunit ribosomal protein S11
MAEEIQAQETPVVEKPTTEVTDKTAEEVVEPKTAKKKSVVDEVLADETDEVSAVPDSRHKKGGKFMPPGSAHIKSTFNNTIVSICDSNGGVISWNSAGRAGFKGSRKSTAYAATVIAQGAAKGAVVKGMREVEVCVQGAGAGRESAIRAIQAAGLNITLIKDITPMPHNGCRQKKRRRV